VLPWGQAVGTAAAICIHKKMVPREVGQSYINELQEQLILDDAYIPSRPANDPDDLAKKADSVFASSTSSGDVRLLFDGVSRDEFDEVHHWKSEGLKALVTLEWVKPVSISKIVVKCDTNVKRNIMMLKYYREDKSYTHSVPVELVKSLDAEVLIDGIWQNVGRFNQNKKRLIKFDFDQIKTSSIRIIINETYGANDVKLFELRCYN
jgi:hypothetical protein